MFYFKNSKLYQNENEPYVGFSKDENGNDWYDAQSNFQKDTNKVLFDEADLRVLIITDDVSRLFPRNNQSVIEMKVENSQMEDGIIYKVDIENLKIIKDEAAHKGIKFSRLRQNIEDKISEYRKKTEECDFGLIEDIVPSYKEVFRELVKFRMTLDKYDVSDKTDIPTIPSKLEGILV